MAWKHSVALLGVARPRRAISTALVYGLSLSVRFTSATGEEVEIPPTAATSIVNRNEDLAFHDDRLLRTSEPIALRLGRPMTSRDCHAACETPLTPDCSAQ